MWFFFLLVFFQRAVLSDSKERTAAQKGKKKKKQSHSSPAAASPKTHSGPQALCIHPFITSAWRQLGPCALGASRDPSRSMSASQGLLVHIKESKYANIAQTKMNITLRSTLLTRKLPPAHGVIELNTVICNYLNCCGAPLPRNILISLYDCMTSDRKYIFFYYILSSSTVHKYLLRVFMQGWNNTSSSLVSVAVCYKAGRLQLYLGFLLKSHLTFLHSHINRIFVFFSFATYGITLRRLLTSAIEVAVSFHIFFSTSCLPHCGICSLSMV